MGNKEIIEKVKALATEGKITCAAARQLAQELNVEYKQVGQACNDAEIKIYACELGCF